MLPNTIKLILPRFYMGSKNLSTKNSKENIFVRIDRDTALKLSKLGYMHEIQSDIIKKVVDHANVCQKWWLERDEEDES